MLFTYYPLYVKFNYGVSLLTAILKQKGVDADYAPCTELKDHINKHDIIGFSFVCKADYEACLPFLRMAKACGKEVWTGGVYARRGGYIDPSLTDFNCRGEAEILPDMSTFHTSHYQIELDSLPQPDLSHVTGYEFDRGWSFLKGKKIIPYQSSRGCPHRCTFCVIQYQPAGVRIKHTIEKDMCTLWEDYRPDLVYLFDEQPPYYMEEWLKQWKFLNVPFVCYLRADISTEHLEFLIEHGLKGCAFGIESGDEEYRNKVLKKNITNRQIYRTIETLKKHNVFYMPFFMTNMPGELWSQKRMTYLISHQVGGQPIIWDYEELKNGI